MVQREMSAAQPQAAPEGRNQMTCPGCHSFDLDPTMHCDGCGYQVSVAQERALRAQMPAPRQTVQDDLLDLAERGVT